MERIIAHDCYNMKQERSAHYRPKCSPSVDAVGARQPSIILSLQVRIIQNSHLPYQATLIHYDEIILVHVEIDLFLFKQIIFEACDECSRNEMQP